MHLATGLVQRLERCAAQLELPAGLKGDRTLAVVRQGDDVALLDDRLPAEAGHAFEKRADAVGTVIGHPLEIAAAEDEFLVLGADPPRGWRLVAALVVFDDLPFVGDRRSLQARRARHAVFELPTSVSRATRINATERGANPRLSPEKPPRRQERRSRRATLSGRARPE